MRDEKKLKATKRRLSIVLWIVAAIAVVTVFNSPERRVARFVADNTEVLEALVARPQPGEVPETLAVQSYERRESGSGQMDEFVLFTRGDTCYGFYYTADDTPRAFQNSAAWFAGNEDGWQWQTDGDSHGYTERLSEHWFYFEASF